MVKYEIEKLELMSEDCVMRVYRPKVLTPKRKTIIHYHGWGSNIETYDLLGKIYANEGYQMVLPEITRHGMRGETDYSTFEETFDVVNQTIDEYKIIKETVIEKLNGDINNLVISGHSLGGVIASGIFAKDLDIKLGLFYNTIIDYSYYKSGALAGKKVNDKIIEKFMERDPMKSIENLSGRNMLIMTGELDNIIPPQVMKQFEEDIEKTPIDSSNIEFSYHEIASHPITYKMVAEALDKTIDILEKN